LVENELEDGEVGEAEAEFHDASLGVALKAPVRLHQDEPKMNA
jgi:hypothetical protein